LVTVLLITRRRRSEPVSGANRHRALAALPQQREDARREIVRRSDAGLMLKPISTSRSRISSISG
jgi:hypothetical protein